MSWNYRVMHRKFKNEFTEEETWAIYEVYYNEKGEIILWTEESVGISGETLEELRADATYYLTALEKPVLEYDTLEEISRGGDKT